MNALGVNSLKLTSLALAVLAATTLVACGGGSDSAKNDPAPVVTDSAPATTDSAPVTTDSAPVAVDPVVADFAFATPASASATAEGGFIKGFGYADAAATNQVLNALAFASGVVTYSEVLSGSPSYAGIGMQIFAPGNATDTGGITFDATSYSSLKIKLATSNPGDAVIKVMLNPSPINPDGCAFTGLINATQTMTEYVLPLTVASFPFSARSEYHCDATTLPTLPTFASVKAGLYNVEFRNLANANGAHDIKLEYVKLSK